MPAYNADLDRFAGLDAQVLGVSVDHVPCLKAWAESLGGINYPLMSDFWPHGKVSQLYGLFRETNGFSERANVIVDETLQVRFVKVYPVHSVPDVNEVIAFLRNL